MNGRPYDGSYVFYVQFYSERTYIYDGFFFCGAVILLEEQWLIDYNKLEIKRYFTVGLVCLSRLERGPLGEIHEIQ